MEQIFTVIICVSFFSVPPYSSLLTDMVLKLLRGLILDNCYRPIMT